MILLNGTQINITFFPDKTSQVWKLENSSFENQRTQFYNEIIWNFENESEFLHLAQLKILIDSVTIKKTHLILNYLPYGRQDKEISNSSTFALYSFAKLLNSLHFDEITIIDPHSTVAIEIIHRAKAVYPFEEVQKVMILTNSNVVCYPDKGAYIKYHQLYPYAFIYAEKMRNQLTGNIENYKLIGSAAAKNILIIDDICDGGMTFKLLARELSKAGASQINLFVTHGIFSKGIKTIKDDGIKSIFTKKGEITESTINNL